MQHTQAEQEPDKVLNSAEQTEARVLERCEKQASECEAEAASLRRAIAELGPDCLGPVHDTAREEHSEVASLVSHLWKRQQEADKEAQDLRSLLHAALCEAR
eukprot:1014850-Amphidinium_carterae.1